ncbi:MAG: mycofactocin biosynthesis chaperone MftB [Dermatophilaceae bacterium]
MSFDATRCYRVNPAVTMRPEPFGALAYDFRLRRLTYLAAGDLVDVLDALAAHPSAAEAMTAVGVAPDRRAALERALGAPRGRGVIDAA